MKVADFEHRFLELKDHYTKEKGVKLFEDWMVSFDACQNREDLGYQVSQDTLLSLIQFLKEKGVSKEIKPMTERVIAVIDKNGGPNDEDHREFLEQRMKELFN